MYLGVAHHFGWAVAVTASSDFEVVDRRRIELIEPGLPEAPVHHMSGTHPMHDSSAPLDDGVLAALVAALVADVRASAGRATTAALDELAAALPEPIASLSVRVWPDDFPTDIAVLRRPPYESRADSVMYCKVLADCGRARGWDVHVYDHRHVERQATEILGDRAGDVLNGPRAKLGPPWAKDHRIALAATVLAANENG